MRIADLPFRERPPLDLLDLHLDRDEPDADYTGFGWCRATVALNDVVVAGALVLALHTVEGGGGAPGDLDLEFFLTPDESVVVSLAKFLGVWRPRLGAGPTVLSVCNPRRVALAGDFHYPLGDVTSWLDPDGRIRLAADEWIIR